MKSKLLETEDSYDVIDVCEADRSQTQHATFTAQTLNMSKSCVMDIVTKRSITPIPVNHTDGQLLKNVSHMLVLDVHFSSNLKWNPHFDEVIKKVSKRWYIIYNLVRSGCPPNLLVRTFNAFIRSLMLYCFPTLCNAPDYLLERFRKVERRFARIATTMPEQTVLCAADAMCVRLFQAFEASSSHPLRVMFCKRQKTARNPHILKPPFARTKRFSTTFIKFARAL